jgi:SPP1 gp7 family putative phage head morphogenesis protein
MATTNETLVDAATLHAIRIERLKNGIVRRMMAVLGRTDADLVIQLEKQIEKMGSTISIARIDSMLKSVRELNSEAYIALNKALEGEMRDFVKYEVTYQRDLFQKVIPVDVSINSVNAEQVYAAAMARPFQGRLLNEWMKGLEADRAIKIRDAIRIGVIEGQTIQQMTQRIRGTKANAYADGLLGISRRNAETIIRTAVSHTQNFARERVMKANEDIIKGEQFVATLDGRTSPECIQNDGRVFDIGEGPIPPLHFNCRSVRVAVLKSFRELGYDIDEIPESTRASLDGQVPADTTYDGWLRTQPKEIQEEVLGKTRAELYRSNELQVTQFINNKGEFYPLDELRKKDLL